MRKFHDERFTYKLMLMKAVDNENKRQLKLWGIQNCTLAEWMLFLTEEVGELAKAIAEYTYREGPPSEIYNEAIETATLALKIAEMIEIQGDVP